MPGNDESVCFVIPTRDRGGDLARTLAQIGRAETTKGLSGEVLIVDNGSVAPPMVPGELPNGMAVRLQCLPFNEGTGARNRVIGSTDADWIVMLDDDSFPTGGGLASALRDAPDDALAVSADIRLPAFGTREMGGLPEVFIGCGVAIRRTAFELAGGYDADFGYYAEEYDLAAKLLLAGGHIRFDPRFRVDHMKSPVGRDMNVILERLVRNNGWVMQRYAPEPMRRAQIREIRRRCADIARRESAQAGYGRGLVAMRRTIGAQPRRPMPQALFDRFTGLAAAREAVAAAHADQPFTTAAVVEPAKNAWCVHTALAEAGVRVVDAADAEAIVIGTMSPGPMLDALERLAGSEQRVIAPWRRAQSGAPSLARAG